MHNLYIRILINTGLDMRRQKGTEKKNKKSPIKNKRDKVGKFNEEWTERL
jgi:hypothetical protein